MRAITQHHVQEDAADAWVRGRLLDHPQPYVEVEHRVRPAARVGLVAEVEDRVPVAVVRAPADVPGDRPELWFQDRRGLVRERAARVQADERAAGAARAGVIDRGLELAGARRSAVAGGQGALL